VATAVKCVSELEAMHADLEWVRREHLAEGQREGAEENGRTRTRETTIQMERGRGNMAAHHHRFAPRGQGDQVLARQQIKAHRDRDVC
jgi:hypothetical protein